MKIFALSDIHGRPVSLDMFVEKGFVAGDSTHHIVLLGDYFDRYPHNVEVYNCVTDLKEKFPSQVHLLLGNHDGFLKRFVDFVLDNSENEIVYEKEFLPHWYRNGGEITIQQLFGDILEENQPLSLYKDRLQELQQFCNSLEDYFETDQSIFTHASIDSERVIDYWDRTPIIKENKLGKNLYIGHTTFKDAMELYDLELFKSNAINYVFNPFLDNKVFMIDNGCGNNLIVVDE